jgi:heavy metal translocating P-type ATPase
MTALVAGQIRPSAEVQSSTGPALGAASLWRKIDRRDLTRTLFLAACTIAILVGLTGPWPRYPVVAIVGLVIGVWPIVVAAWADLRHRRMSMELSMLIAIVAAALIGEWLTALVVTTFVLAAEILEDLSLDRGHDALTDLMTFLPSFVQVREADAIQSVPLDEVAVGQTVVIPPGARIPVDGTVMVGQSSVDQSRITGESLPVDVRPGSTVFAGSVNHMGALEIRAEHIGAASSYGQIIDAVKAAQESQAPVQRLADRLAGYLVYIALGGALLTYLVTRDLEATISVVLVAGACGIAAGTPLAILAAIGRAARTGAFFKSGTHLEQLSRINTVIFDKTGTLTEGRPRVVVVRPAANSSAADVLTAAATAELYSEHPLGQAIIAEARDRGLTLGQPESFEYEPGRGLTARVAGRLVQVGNDALVLRPVTDPRPHNLPSVQDSPDRGAKTQAVDATEAQATEAVQSLGVTEAQGTDTAGPSLGRATAVHVAAAGRYLGTIYLADAVRPTAHQCVADLRALGLRVIMLTGDSARAGQAVGTELGLDDVRTDLLPADKLAIIDAERATGARIAMVGDGVNDAPALAQADVGIAMGSGTEVARQSADVILISSDPSDLTRAIRLARRARRIVLTNFVGTIAIDLIGMVLAACGVIGPLIAGVIHVGSESAFILNSARLIPGRRPRSRT